MIALQSLKYKILEWCIDTLANKLIGNFNLTNNGLTRLIVDDLEVGMHLTEIVIFNVLNGSERYHVFRGCKIIEKEIYGRKISYSKKEGLIQYKIVWLWDTLESNNIMYDKDGGRQEWDCNTESVGIGFYI